MDEDIEFLPLIPIEENASSEDDIIPDELPLLPLRNSVLFPGVVIPITVGRDKSVRAIKAANKKNKYIGVIAQNDPEIEEPELSDLHQTGTVARIIKSLKLPDGSNTVIIQGKKRFNTKSVLKEEPYFLAEIDLIEEEKVNKNPKMLALMDSIKDFAFKIIEISPNIPSEAGMVLKNVDDPVFLTSFIASNLNISIEDKQKLLEIHDMNEKCEKLLQFLNQELQMTELKNQIANKVRVDIDKQQRDYFLNQQMKTIQEELGGQSQSQELEEIIKKSKEKKWGKDVQKIFQKETQRLQRMNPAVAEYSILLNYLDLLLELPWNEYTEDNFDLKRAIKVLDREHYGLEKIKERIIEYLAVLKLKGDLKASILCFVGPPGVGKTSLGKSIAAALNRSYVRMSLGGLHDESEIRGHRKTYIGALPGRIIQSIKKAGSSNPVFILDEIDKVGNNFRGDPSSALLEVLDPEQNHAFYDNYLETEYDLSKVMFIATANRLDEIQPALRDRMEIIHVSGYSLEEKIEIARNHLVKRQLTNHGLSKKQVRFTKKGLEKLIYGYTRESGVRELDRKIAAVMRRIAKSVVLKEKYEKSIRPEVVEDLLGKPSFDSTIFTEKHPAGVAIGLAWTSVGGELLFIETNLTKSNKGGIKLTGNLGDVMKESAATAYSYLKANHESLGLNPSVFNKQEIHIHIPEGAIPKDGPSAGITMFTAMASAFTNIKVRPRLAMTGEITLRGKVLPVGGIKEKILAAKRSGMKTVLLCRKNEKDVLEIDQDYLKGLKIVYVDTVDDVLDYAIIQ